MTVRITALSLLACPILLLSANHGCEAGVGGFLTNGAYTLVTPERMSETDAFVAEDMNALLARALGGELKVAHYSAAPRSHRLFFAIAPKGLDMATLEDQERCTIVEDGDIYVFGGGTNGNRYAAYDFLQNTLGYRFFDTRGGVKVPDLSQLVLTNMVRRTKFAFKFRSFSTVHYYNGPEAALFFFRHGFNGDLAKQMMVNEGLPETMGCDFFKPWPFDCASECYLPRSPRERRQVRGAAKICGELAKEHPEYFSLSKDGERDIKGQRCFFQ